ncbi:MAG: GNAT family N-acetyltransferase [Alphaproteobacteria bacterium]
MAGPAVILRPARPDECAALSLLAVRSKASWGYDDDFMAQCRDELTLHPSDVEGGTCVVAEVAGAVAGVYALAPLEGGAVDVRLFFVDPPLFGTGVGRAMFRHMAAEARRAGYDRIVIEADPGAAPFYRRMGARPAGRAPSGSIPGRRLPRLVYDL